MLCEVCVVAVETYTARERRSRLIKDPAPKQPRWVEILLVRDTKRGFALQVKTDVGHDFHLQRLESIDVRDARSGATKLISYRSKK